MTAAFVSFCTVERRHRVIASTPFQIVFAVPDSQPLEPLISFG